MKITIEQLEFPISVKDKITKIPNISKLDIKFINGKYIHFNNTNISINDPHKIIISNNSYCLILLYYENDNNLEIDSKYFNKSDYIRNILIERNLLWAEYQVYFYLQVVKM